MDLVTLREQLLSLPGAREDMPFDDQTLVFKVGKKMFALLSLDAFPLSMNLKCDPDRAMELRESYECIKPGYHMNKKHWNTLRFTDELPATLARELIQHSYDLVFASLSAKERTAVLEEAADQ